MGVEGRPPSSQTLAALADAGGDHTAHITVHQET